MIRIILTTIITVFFSLTAYADMNDANKSKAWYCSGIYMANYFLPATYFLPPGETLEYTMKVKSIASAKVLKAYALETGVPEINWNEGANKAIVEYYNEKYDKVKTDECHAFLEALILNGKERVNKVVQTLY